MKVAVYSRSLRWGANNIDGVPLASLGWWWRK